MTHINGSYADRERDMWECLLRKGSAIAKWRLTQAEKTCIFFIKNGDDEAKKTHRLYPEMFKEA